MSFGIDFVFVFWKGATHDNCVKIILCVWLNTCSILQHEKRRHCQQVMLPCGALTKILCTFQLWQQLFTRAPMVHTPTSAKVSCQGNLGAWGSFPPTTSRLRARHIWCGGW